MNPLLQNNPYERPFPVKARRRNFEASKTAHPLLYALAVFVFTLASVSLFYVIVLLQKLMNEHTTPTQPQWIAIFVFLFLVSAFILIARYLCSLPVREQLQYYKASGSTWLSEDKRQALRLHVVDMFYSGYWSETLEYYPLAALQGSGKYYSLRPSDAATYKKSLDQDWGVLTKENYRKVAQQLLTKGYHAEIFAVTLNLRNEDQAVSKRLAALTHLPEAYILECLQSRPGGRPPKLIWGYECWRAVVVARNAFMAGHITADEAWHDMLLAADYAFELFDSFEDFNNNYRLGNAFWSNSYDVTSEKIKYYNLFKEECKWPMAQLPWPAPKGVKLPPAMANGYFNEVTIAKSLRQQPGGLN